VRNARRDPLAEHVAATAKAAEVASAELSRLVLTSADEDEVRAAYREVAAADAARALALSDWGRENGYAWLQPVDDDPDQ
jgi:hypothetical protein